METDKHGFLQVLRRAEGSLGGYHAGQLHRHAADAKAVRIIAEELQRNSWSEADFLARRKEDPTKLAIAARLRRETTLLLKAIAAGCALELLSPPTARCTAL